MCLWGFFSRSSQRKTAWKEKCSLYGLSGMKTTFNTEILENSLFHFPAHSCFCNYLKRIQNFPGKNGNPKGVCQPIILAILFPKNA